MTLRALLLALGLTLAAATQAQTPPLAAALRQRFLAELDRIASDLDGVLGYAVVDLTSRERWGRMETVPFPTMSTIKLAALYELFRQADEGRVSLDERQVLERRHVVGGTGVLSFLGTPALTLRDHATLMVVLSDNTSTNVLIDAVGMERVMARMRSLGLETVKLRRKMMDQDAVRRGEENVAAPADLARLFELVERGEGLTAASREAMLLILKIPKETPLRKGVPEGIEVASKPGWDGASVWADGGIVYAPGRPYVFVVMTTYLKSPDAGATAIERASRTAFDYFSRLGTGSEYGRRVPG